MSILVVYFLREGLTTLSRIERNQLESCRLAVDESTLSNDFSLISLCYCVEQEMLLVMKIRSDGSRT